MPKTCEYCESADGKYRPSHDEHICADCVRTIMGRYGEKFPDEEIRDVIDPCDDDEEQCAETED